MGSSPGRLLRAVLLAILLAWALVAPWVAFHAGETTGYARGAHDVFNSIHGRQPAAPSQRTPLRTL